MELKQNHFYWLDALRFIAAFMVLFSHTRNDFFLPWGELPSEQHNPISLVFYFLGRLGHEAVIVFFVLSGFLVGGRGFERIQKGDFRIANYLIDRFSRIYPPLLITILFYFITCIFIDTENWDWAVAFCNLLNLQGICCKSLVSPFWSLSYEWWFYLVLATIGLIATRKRKMAGFLLFVITTSIFIVNIMKLHYLLIWIIGAISYLTRPDKKNIWVLCSSFIGILVGIILWQISTDSNSIQIAFKIENSKIIEVFLATMVAIFVQQIILYEPKNNFVHYIEYNLGRLAIFSYTLYLAHRVVLMWVFKFIFDKSNGDMSVYSFCSYFAILAICLFSCWILYLCAEKYSPNIRKYLKNKFIHYNQL